MAERPWRWLLGAAIPIVWIWFALLGIEWNVLASLFIAISVTIIFGTLYAVMESTGDKKSV